MEQATWLKYYGQWPKQTSHQRMQQMTQEKMTSSYVVREMEIKTAMRQHCTPIRMARVQNTDTIKHQWGCGATRTHTHCCWERKTAQQLWKTVWWLLTKLNIILPYDPAIAHLGIYPKKSKTYVHTKNLHISIYNNLL